MAVFSSWGMYSASKLLKRRCSFQLLVDLFVDELGVASNDDLGNVHADGSMKPCEQALVLGRIVCDVVVVVHLDRDRSLSSVGETSITPAPTLPCE